YTTLCPSNACPALERISLPVAGSHRRTVLSSLAEARILPSGDHATHWTGSSCPEEERISLPVAGSQRRTVLYWLAEARVLPSGDQDTHRTESYGPEQERISLPVAGRRGESCCQCLPRPGSCRPETTPRTSRP